MAVALVVLTASVALRFLSAILNAVVFGTRTAGSPTTGLYDLAFPFATYWWGGVIGVLPFAIGVFLSLWLVLPITAKQSLARVIGTSLLAVAVGAVVGFAFALAGSLLRNFDESAGQVFGWASGLFSTVSANADWAVVQALYTAVGAAKSLIPLTVLAGVLVWIRLRAHPVEVGPAGLAVEV
jgi:hypothetical protein